MKLQPDFYAGEDVVKIARDLIGKVLFTRINKVVTAGIITETEAYAGIHDRASHAYGGRNTHRTRIMYSQGGNAYIYLCYGIHSLFNVVTNQKGIPHAVLIRSVIPYINEAEMLRRRGAVKYNYRLFYGPGKVTQALGIDYSLTGLSLAGRKIWIEDKGIVYADSDIDITPRIGVDYAGEDARLPYRFVVRHP